jgi:hypothetical protein
VLAFGSEALAFGRAETSEALAFLRGAEAADGRVSQASLCEHLGGLLVYRPHAFLWHNVALHLNTAQWSTSSDTLVSATSVLRPNVLHAPSTHVDADMPLMQAGVNSMLAIHLSSQLRALTGLDLSPTILFDQPTPRSVARHLADSDSPMLTITKDVVKFVSEQLAESLAPKRMSQPHPIPESQGRFFRDYLGAALPMTIPMLRDCALGAFHMLQKYHLEPNDDCILIQKSLERLVMFHPMFRAEMTPPVFRIKQNTDFELDQGRLSCYDDGLCFPFVKCDIDLTKSVFRARTYNLDGHAALLVLSIHHVVLDGPSQQIVFSTLSGILANERRGLAAEQSVAQAYDASKLAEDAIVSHLHVLETGSINEFLPHPFQLLLSDACTRAVYTPFEFGMRSIQRAIGPHTIAALNQIAVSSGVTLNSILLGMLATHLRACSGQDKFAINQTYHGRRLDQLQMVGSYSGPVAIQFTFDDHSLLLSACQHAFTETMKSMAASDRAVASSMLMSNVSYELNDLRPITCPSLTNDKEQVDKGYVLCDLFFIVNEYVDGVAAMVLYDVSKFEHPDTKYLLEGWLQLLEGIATH